MEQSKAYRDAKRSWWNRTTDMNDRELWAAFARFEHADTPGDCGALAAIQAEIDHRDCYY